MAATPCDSEPPPSALLSGDLAARLRQMMGSANSSSSSPEEIVEAARSAASAAAGAAAAARATAAEKAAVAAKARAAARAAMEFLDSISRPGTSRNGLQLKVKSRKKHVQLKFLYKPNGRPEGRGTTGDPSKPRRRKESDEEIARKLHRAMNSSPRISFTGPKRPRTIGGENGGVVDACNGASAHLPIEVSGITDGCSLGQSSETPAPFFKHKGLDDDKGSSAHAAKSRDIAGGGTGVGHLSAGRKVKIKRKELLLNQHNSKDTEETKETEPSIDSIRYNEGHEPKSNGADKGLNLADAKRPGDGLVPMKITSVWKFKKFKTSHCSSDSKMLHNECPSTSAAKTSASVKAD
ncbi:hypothetical protein GUJ93_ZPchr0006g45074 [Zizania palustris]|uniref:Uncharacterized protein n=1 Tax=Zizania palustris TaxID=103762 RepID=A0A8J5T095_ZIZPA|nr:hypothetical protein GUJ93_ZPchr0006g45074 [Zizania palustris]